MRKIFPLFLLVVLAAYGYSQDNTPIPRSTPSAPITLLPTPTAEKVPENDVVKITTTLVQFDVTVTDKNGRTITDLRPDEVEIYENGQKRDISHFSFIPVERKAIEKKKNDKNAIPVPEPPRALRPDQVKHTIALVVDDLSISFESAVHIRSALRKFVDEQMQDGDLVSIIRTGTGAGAMQQFTTDKKLLYAAIEQVRWNGSGRGKLGSFEPIEPTNLEMVRATNPDHFGVGSDIVTEAAIQQDKDFRASTDNFRDGVFVTGTLGALNFIIDGMKQLPGRKSVVLLSDGFKLFTKNEQGSPESSRILEFLRDLAANANRAAVVIYTIDSRGLETVDLTAEDRPLIDPLNKPLGPELSGARSDRADELFQTQQGLVYLAKKTGGFAIINKNDVSAGLNEILEDQSYYLVAYTPPSEGYDAAAREKAKFEIKVNRPGAQVRYRSEFAARERGNRMSLIEQNTGGNLMKAVVSPFAVNDINVKLNVLFGYSKKRGYYVHSFLYIDPKDLNFKKLPNGDYQTVFDILAIGYTNNGLPAEKNSITATLQYTEEIYRKFLERGFAYSFVFPIKNPGAYQMRVGLQERGTNKMGSASQFIEIPNLKKEGLTLSGVVLENMTDVQWERFVANLPMDNMVGHPDPIDDTSKRQFKRGTVLRFGVEIYNPKMAPQQMQVNLQARLYHEGVLVFQSKELPMGAAGQINEQQAFFTDAVLLGKQLLPGDYIVQVVAIDTQGKRKIATQFVQFEVVE